VAELKAFFYMGGYAFYVWPSFIISLLVLLGNVMYSKAQFKRVLRETTVRTNALADKKSTRNTTKKVNQ